ncbi:Gem-associated protein 8 [Microtus ochrogaster]|uniref:Gem-associated protein 8 n=1 Tax=Microtus ochrogaster TaxID=79684 RepID=A0A8J6FW21_MICOH|nr:Gem-associated protein 8 [Microtus ochrogaster]
MGANSPALVPNRQARDRRPGPPSNRLRHTRTCEFLVRLPVSFVQHRRRGVLPWNPVASEAGHPWNYQGQHVVWQEPPYSVSHLQSSGQPLYYSSRIQATTREDEAPYEEEEMESDSDNEIECDLSNMEITEELRQYFAETERHREERRRQQQLEAERLDDYVNADHGLYYNHHRSTEPPLEKPGERRQAEMKRLYGDSAPKILAMEAAVQMSFDKYCDKKQPKYWPVIPLKF